MLRQSCSQVAIHNFKSENTAQSTTQAKSYQGSLGLPWAVLSARYGEVEEEITGVRGWGSFRHDIGAVAECHHRQTVRLRYMMCAMLSISFHHTMCYIMENQTVYSFLDLIHIKESRVQQFSFKRRCIIINSLSEIFGNHTLNSLGIPTKFFSDY